MTTKFSQLMKHAKRAQGAALVDVPSDWMQGRTVFGGLQVAIALEAMRTLVRGTTLRTLQATFVAPVAEGVVAARANVMRQGKSATHVEARLVEDDVTLAVVIGVFGSARASKAVRHPTQPVVTDEAATEIPFVAGLFPSFTQHFTARWLRGAFPFSGQPNHAQVIEVGMKDDGPTTEGHVISIADFIPPVALSHLDSPAPGSTLTWMLEFLRDDVGKLPLTGWRVDAELVAARDGYTSQSVMVFGPDGTPVALSRQSMLVFG
jgi:acyl-CoA thioesterase